MPRIRRIGSFAPLVALIAIGFCAGPGVSAPVAGADVSWLPAYEDAGAIYRFEGRRVDPVRLMLSNDLTLMRLRLWHTPAEAWNGLPRTLDFADTLSRRGADIMLDIHYSDTWADPGHQIKPAAWRDLALDALADSVRAYTAAVLRSFDERGVALKYVQIGNEISSGFLWDEGRVGGTWDTPEQWSKLCALLDAALSAVRQGRPEGERPLTVLHVDNGADNALCRWFFDHIRAGGVEFDAIAVSYYPWWHGSLADLEANLRDLGQRYGKPVMVVETAYPWTLAWCDSTHNIVGLPAQLLKGYPATPGGQAAFMSALLSIVSSVPDGLGTALIYWEPAAICVRGGPGSPWENLALFDFGWEALPALFFAERARPDSAGSTRAR
jgi:arabinogalactan endo-1,4-beta-galactosidase